MTGTLAAAAKLINLTCLKHCSLIRLIMPNGLVLNPYIML